MKDIEIKCQGVDNNTPCPDNATFTHSVKDQEFYQRQGFEAPKRCRECREAKKALKNGGQGNFRSNKSRRSYSPDRELYGAEGRD